MKRLAAIMAGGSGERFWPISRASRPKQLLHLANPDRSLLGEAVDRIEPLVGKENVYVLTGRPIEKEVRSSGVVLEQNVIAEPDKRNTLGCLCWFAANLIAKGDADVSMAVLTADHKIGEPDRFRAVIKKAFECAEETCGLVTLGMTPARPETGYGYIEFDGATSNSEEPHAVISFREKPDLEHATQFVHSGKFLWNSGMFVWKLRSFLNELHFAHSEAHALIEKMAGQIRENRVSDAESTFRELPNLSIDYALMEKAKSVFVVEADFPWDDVGAWDALLRTMPLDAMGNASYGDVLTEDSSGCVVYSDHAETVACLLGVQDLVVVVAGDAILVCPKDRAQEVRTFVQKLKDVGDHRV